MGRTSLLGGERGHRRLLDGGRSKTANRVLVVEGIVTVFWCLTNPMVGGGLGLLLVVLTYYAVRPRPDEGPVRAEVWLGRAFWWARQRRGTNVFIPSWSVTTEAADVRDPAGKRVGGHHRARRGYVAETPRAVGGLAWINVPVDGTSLLVQSHDNPGEEPYYALAFEVPGLPVTISSDAKYELQSELFGQQLLARLAKKSSLTCGVQQLARVVPTNGYRHDEWLARRLGSVARTPRILLESYGDLVASSNLAAPNQRHFVVAKIPRTDRWEEAKEATGLTGLEATGAVMRAEAQRITAALAAAGQPDAVGLGRLRFAGLLRHLQNPSFELDQHGDVDERTCWLPTVGAKRHVYVDDEWYTRVAQIRSQDIKAAPVSVRLMEPLLTRVAPDVVRTLSVHHSLVPQATARAAAVADHTMDRGKATEQRNHGEVDDGTTKTLMTASKARLKDLSQDEGHQGDHWSAWIAVSARTERGLRHAVEDVEEKASSKGINTLSWVDERWPGRHDDALVTCLPLARANRKVKL